MKDVIIDEYNLSLKEHKEKFGVEPNVIGMFWQHPEKVHESIKKSVKEGKPYDEYLMLSKEDRKAWDNGHLFF